MVEIYRIYKYQLTSRLSKVIVSQTERQRDRIVRNYIARRFAHAQKFQYWHLCFLILQQFYSVLINNCGLFLQFSTAAGFTYAHVHMTRTDKQLLTDGTISSTSGANKLTTSLTFLAGHLTLHFFWLVIEADLGMFGMSAEQGPHKSTIFFIFCNMVTSQKY